MDTAFSGAAARSVDAGRGVGWWTDAWALFMKNAGMWIVLALIMLVITFVLALIPFLGGLALCLLFPVFSGSWMLAARKLESGGTLEVGDLFVAFTGDKLTSLVVIGALVLAVSIVIGIVAFFLGLGAVFGAAAGSSTGGFISGMLAVLISLAIGFVAGMALWFAPALVVLRGMAPVDALKASFGGSLKNIVAFILFGIVYIVAAIVASIPFGLGWIVLVPLLMLTMYVGYKDIFNG